MRHSRNANNRATARPALRRQLRLNDYALAYVHVIESRIRGIDEREADEAEVSSKEIRRLFKGTLAAAGGFTRESAEQIVIDGHADLVAFGRMFIANPDLPERLRTGKPLNRYDRSTFYGGDARGYIDYPFASRPSPIRQDAEFVEGAHA